MSPFVLDLGEIEEQHAAQTGGKALALARLLRSSWLPCGARLPHDRS